MTWRVGDRFDMDGRPAIVTEVNDRVYDEAGRYGLLIRDWENGGRAAVAVDWESVERTPDGGPRSLGRMIR